MPWLNGWTYRKKLTIDQTKIDANLTDFPVLVHLHSGLHLNTDLTTGKTATADSENGTETADKAIDNNTGTFWTSATSGSPPRWLKVDLGSGGEKIAGKYSITSRKTGDNNGVPTSWKLQGSNDNSNWTDLHTVSGESWADDGPKTYSFTTNSTSYRYYRLYITATTGGVYVQIKEFELFEFVPPNFDFSKVRDDLNDIKFTSSDEETEIPYEIDEIYASDDTYGSNFFTGGTAAASEGTAANAFDSNPSTLCASGPSDPFPHWVTYDLGAGNTKTIRKLGLDAFINVNGGYVKDFTLWGSNLSNPSGSNDSDWTLIYTGQHANTGNLEEYTFSNGTAYRHYRIKVTSNWRSFTDYGIDDLYGYELAASGGLPYEVFLWVKIPTVDAAVNTEFYIYYGKSDESLANEDPANVWDSSHKCVLHLSEQGNGTSGEYKDSTSNNNHGTGNSAPTKANKTTGKIGSQQTWVTANNVQIADNAAMESAADSFVLSMKIRIDSFGGGDGVLTRFTDGNSYFYIAFEGSTNLRFRDYNSGNIIDFTINPGMSTGVWYDLEYVRNGNDFSLWIDNVQKGSTVTDSDSLLNRSVAWNLGAESNLYNSFNGKLDEFRLSVGTARSAAWRKARIESDNETILTLGTEEENQGTVVQPSVLDGILDLQTPSVIIDTTIQPNVLDIASEVLDPQAIGIVVTVTAAVLDIASEIEDPLISISPTILVNVLDMTADVQEPIVPQHATITPAVFDLITSVLAPAFVGESITAAEFATKILSFNPLVFVTDTNPIKVVKVDISVPSAPTWEVYSIPGASSAKDVVYNAIFNLIYVACANGRIVKINASDFNDFEIIDTGDANNLLKLASLDGFHRLYAGTDDTTGEVIYIDQATLGSLSMNVQCLQKINGMSDTDIRVIQGGSLGTDIQCLGTKANSFGMDIRILTDPFEEVALDPIKQTDFHVHINGSEIDDVLLDSIKIYHAIGEKSSAAFTVKRRHDELNQTVNGQSSQITNQNDVQIYIQNKLEFSGKVARLRTDSENETVEITALGDEKANERNTLTIPLASINEKLHPYHCLVDNEDIFNPFIDPNDENPEVFFGVEIDLGTEIQQGVSRWIALFDVSDELIDGTFQPKQNWTYFWFCKATNFLTGIKQATSRYIGTSPAGITGDFWEIDSMTYRYQREFDDKVKELGIFQLGSAPFKKINVRNGCKLTKDKWVDKADGLYTEKDAGYNFVEYAKTVAQLEYEKIKNINDNVLPITSCDVELMIDGYYFYNPKLLTRINIDNTTTPGIYRNNNGFPVAVKAIEIDSNTMRVSMKCDNQKSDIELQEIDDQFPDPESEEFNFPEESVRQFSKFDYSRFENVQ